MEQKPHKDCSIFLVFFRSMEGPRVDPRQACFILAFEIARLGAMFAFDLSTSDPSEPNVAWAQRRQQ